MLHLLIIVGSAGFVFVEAAASDSNELRHQASFRRGEFRHTLAATSPRTSSMRYHRQPTHRSKSAYSLIDIQDDVYGLEMNLDYADRAEMPVFGEYDQRKFLQAGSLSQNLNLSVLGLGYDETAAVADPLDRSNPELQLPGHSPKSFAEKYYSDDGHDGEIVRSESGYVSPESSDIALVTTESDVYDVIISFIDHNDVAGTALSEIELDCDRSIQEYQVDSVLDNHDHNLGLETDRPLVGSSVYLGTPDGTGTVADPLDSSNPELDLFGHSPKPFADEDYFNDDHDGDNQSNSDEIARSESGYVSPESESSDIALVTTERCRQSDVCNLIMSSVDQDDIAGTALSEIELDCDRSVQEYQVDSVLDNHYHNLGLETNRPLVKSAIHLGTPDGTGTVSDPLDSSNPELDLFGHLKPFAERDYSDDSHDDDNQSNSGEIVRSESGYVSPESEQNDIALVTTERCRESDVCGLIMASIDPNDLAGTALAEIELDSDRSLQECHVDSVLDNNDQNLGPATDSPLVGSAIHLGMDSGPPLFAGADSCVKASTDEEPSYVSLSSASMHGDITLSFVRLDLSLIVHLLHPSYSRKLVSFVWNEPRRSEIGRIRTSPPLRERNDRLSALTYQSFVESVCEYILSRPRFNWILLSKIYLDLRHVIRNHLEVREVTDENRAGCCEISETKHEQFGILAINNPAITTSACESSDCDRYCNNKPLEEEECRSEKQEEECRLDDQEKEIEFQKQEEEYWSQRSEEVFRSEKPRKFSLDPETESNETAEMFISCELQPVPELSSEESASNSHAKLASSVAFLVFLVCISGIVLKSRMQQRNGTRSCNDATKQGEGPL